MSNQVLASQLPQPLRTSEAMRVSGPDRPELHPKVSSLGNADVNRGSAGLANEVSAPKILDNAVSSLNDFAQKLHRELRFSIDDDSGRTVITVTDPETDEIIRQIPPEEVLRIAKSLEDNSGLLLRAQV